LVKSISLKAPSLSTVPIGPDQAPSPIVLSMQEPIYAYLQMLLTSTLKLEMSAALPHSTKTQYLRCWLPHFLLGRQKPLHWSTFMYSVLF
jgi:hypothetical protein